MDNICSDQDLSHKAIEFYQNWMSKRFTIKECPYPCTFTKISIRNKGIMSDSNTFYLEFNKFIKATKARYAYRELELLAEFGGYVGLFLGISIFDLRQAFVKVILPIINN